MNNNDTREMIKSAASRRSVGWCKCFHVISVAKLGTDDRAAAAEWDGIAASSPSCIFISAAQWLLAY